MLFMLVGELGFGGSLEGEGDRFCLRVRRLLCFGLV